MMNEKELKELEKHISDSVDVLMKRLSDRIIELIQKSEQETIISFGNGDDGKLTGVCQLCACDAVSVKHAFCPHCGHRVGGHSIYREGKRIYIPSPKIVEDRWGSPKMVAGNSMPGGKKWSSDMQGR